MAPDRGATVKQSSSRAWEGLTPSLSEWILTATSAMGFDRMTPVQASTIPLFMAHKDVVVEAVTGSGKTMAFLIPVVERLLRLEEPIKRHHVGAIILSPTRELATQIYHVLLTLLEFHEPSATAVRNSKPTRDDDGQEETTHPLPSTTPKVLPQLLLGGTTTAAQDLSTFLKTSPNLLVSTPGRLLEVLSSPYVHCPQSSFEVLVLDEADRLLDLGFKDDLTKILSFLPKQRRTGLFSASVSEAVDQLIRVGLRNPVRIAVRVKGSSGVKDKRTPASLKMTYSITKPSQKLPALCKLLDNLSPTPLRSIVYLSTCAAVDYFSTLIRTVIPSNIAVIALHGKHPSTVRTKNFLKFTTSASATLLLTTDVAARGLDVPSVDLVVQLDPPSDPKVFLHRCGRAGRAGRRGLSVVFLTPGREEDYVSFLAVRKTPLEPLDSPDISIADEEAAATTVRLRDVVMTDRGLHDKAQKAFVSFVRAYSAHQASSIFRVADLDWVDLADAWGLLRLPKMPELKHFQGGHHIPLIEWNEYAYKDKLREKMRKEQIVAKDASDGKDVTSDRNRKRASSQAWSQVRDQKEKRDQKRSKKAARREHERVTSMTDAEKQWEEETKRMVDQVRQQQMDVQMELKDDGQVFQGFD